MKDLVLGDWDRLTPEQQQSLTDQISRINFDQLERLFEQAENEAETPDSADLKPLPVEESVSDADVAAGEDALRRGEVAVLLVAGGQGSRLNFDHPKGMFTVGPVSDRTLFDIHAGKVLALSRRYDRPVRFLIMTSPATHDETVEFFEDRGFFGLSRSQVSFFQQATMPAVDIETGRLLQSEPGELFASPNGHGGTLTALADSGLLDELKSQGVRHVFYFQVDNPLVKIADPGFLGRHISTKSELSVKIIDKAYPKEKMGVFVETDGRCAIIEYSDLPDELAELTDDQGKLLYRAGNPAIHLFDVDFLKRVTQGDSRLPFHVARKKVPCVGADGGKIEPTEPNGLKFEMFIFDAFPMADRWLALRTTREEEFAPVKNAEGDDSPATSRCLMSNLARSWLAEAGVSVPDDVPVEIAPTCALDAAELKRKLPANLKTTEPIELK